MPRFRLPYLLLTALYCAGIFYLSAQSDLSDIRPTWLDFAGADKVEHALVFGGLAATITVGLWRSTPTLGRVESIVVPLGFTLLYGLSDELHQLYVPGRTFEWLDLLADATGATIMNGGVRAMISWTGDRARRAS